MPKIKKAAVLGAGIMGRGIAALLASVHIPCYLLDIVPRELTEQEKKAGFSLDDIKVRNRFAINALNEIIKSKPPLLFDSQDVTLIKAGNLEDHLNWLLDADWVVEAVTEKIEVKQDLFKKIVPYLKPQVILSSNTSGLSINEMASTLPEEIKCRFLGTHFFNPARYMRLLEVVPGQNTLGDIVEYIAHFGEKELGKEVVVCKDTPNFIANRIGVFALITTIKAMMEFGLSVPEVDALTGPLIGRPSSATFRTLDLVGIDTVVYSVDNLQKKLKDETEKEYFRLPDFVNVMLSNGWLGNKTGQGFYKPVKTNGRTEYLVLDYKSMEYKPQTQPFFISLDSAKNTKNPAERLKILTSRQDKASEFVWQIMRDQLIYAADKLGEIADDIMSIDKAMETGFNWDRGPFRVWDLLGLQQTAEKIRRDGKSLPLVIENMLENNKNCFYYKNKQFVELFYSIGTGEYMPIPKKPEIIILDDEKARGNVILKNNSASLVDIGNGVCCLEFHSSGNAIDQDIIDMLYTSLEAVDRDFLGMVVGNQGKNFCAGANLKFLLSKAQEHKWSDIEAMVSSFQEAMLHLKYFSKPVVAAPFGMTIGGGCELCLHSHQIQAYSETYMGQVESRVGLVPAGGGCKELLLRFMNKIPYGVKMDFQPLVTKVFDLIFSSWISTSASEAKSTGFLRTNDGFSTNLKYLLNDAKEMVIMLDKMSFRPPVPVEILVGGKDSYANLFLNIETMFEGGYITEYDKTIAQKIAWILCGGDVPGDRTVPERYLLELERESFLSLIGNVKTQERIEHMLSTGKALRN